jgi:hypothetical protein
MKDNLGAFGESIRATGLDAIRIAELESCPREPLWLTKFAEPKEDARVGLSLDQAREIAAVDRSLIYLSIGRVAWCVIGSVDAGEHVLEGPFATQLEAQAKVFSWADAAATVECAEVTFIVGIRWVEESWLAKLRRRDTEDADAKAALEAKQKAAVLKWMRLRWDEYETSTELAEAAAHEALEDDHDEWLDDEDHWIWDLAVKVRPTEAP